MVLNRPIRRYRDLSAVVVSTRAFGVAPYRVSCPCMPSTATFSEQYRYRTSHRVESLKGIWVSGVVSSSG